MQIDKKQTIANIVRDNYKAAEVFSKHNIDFCCGGKKPIGEVCEKEGIDLDDILGELELTVATKDSDTAYKDWESHQLIDHIVRKHHTYVSDTVPYLSELINKIATVHGDHHPELIEVRDIFLEAVGALGDHMMKEENILFPAIKALESAQKNGEALPDMAFGTVNNPIAMMEQEHDFEGDSFKKIAELTNDFTPPADGCNTYHVAFAKLKEFVEDLHQHIHLENNILFENAKTLEAGLK